MARRFGIEIEFFCPDVSVQAKLVRAIRRTAGKPFCGKDPTCWCLSSEGEGDLEIKTPAVRSTSEIEPTLKALERIWLRTSREIYPVVHPLVGTHVHVSFPPGDPGLRQRLMESYIDWEWLLYSLQPSYRVAINNPSIDNSLDFFGKNYGINFSHFETVEFRMGMSSVRATDHLRWAELLVQFVDRSTTGDRIEAPNNTVADFISFLRPEMKVTRWIGRRIRLLHKAPPTREKVTRLHRKFALEEEDVWPSRQLARKIHKYLYGVDENPPKDTYTLPPPSQPDFDEWTEEALNG